MRSHLHVMIVEDQSSHTGSNIVACVSAIKKRCLKKMRYSILKIKVNLIGCYSMFISINVSALEKLFYANDSKISLIYIYFYKIEYELSSTLF